MTDDWALGQNLVDFYNEERRSSHYEISPRERDDEQERDRHEFDPEPDDEEKRYEQLGTRYGTDEDQ